MSTESFFYDYMKVEDVGKYYADFFEDFDEKKFEELINSIRDYLNKLDVYE